MKKSVVFPARIVYDLMMGQSVGFYDQPCLHGETVGFVMYTSTEKSYDKLYLIDFHHDKDGNAISVMLNNFMNTLMYKSVNMIVVGSFFVYRELIHCIGSFKDTVSKSVGEIKCRKSPYFGRLSDIISRVVLLESEKFNVVFVVMKSDDV